LRRAPSSLPGGLSHFFFEAKLCFFCEFSDVSIGQVPADHLDELSVKIQVVQKEDRHGQQSHRKRRRTSTMAPENCAARAGASLAARQKGMLYPVLADVVFELGLRRIVYSFEQPIVVVVRAQIRHGQLVEPPLHEVAQQGSGHAQKHLRGRG
jgi:hypothetical protein